LNRRSKGKKVKVTWLSDALLVWSMQLRIFLVSSVRPEKLKSYWWIFTKFDKKNNLENM